MTISGDLGSGKSVLTTALVERWQAERYSTGLVQRQLAESMGITTLELNKRAETDKSIDDLIDGVFRSLAQTPVNLVVDSRMAFHFLPQSFRIKLEVNPRVAALRVKGDTSRVGEGQYNSLEEIEAALVARKSSERERFIRYYNADIDDQAGFVLVINTTSVLTGPVNAVANACVAAWRNGKDFGKLWVSPRYLYCLEDPASLDAEGIHKAESVDGDLMCWPVDAVEVVKQGPLYIVIKGAAWVAGALRAKRDLICVTKTSQDVRMPLDDLSQRWEKSFHYNHMS